MFQNRFEFKNLKLALETSHGISRKFRSYFFGGVQGFLSEQSGCKTVGESLKYW